MTGDVQQLPRRAETRKHAVHRGPTVTRGALAHVAPRLFWAALLGIHLPIAVRAAQSAAETGISGPWLAKTALLAATIAFFALKFADVPFLRLPTRRASWLAFLLITAIVHHKALSVTDTHVPVTWAVAAATPFAATALWRRRRSIRRNLQGHRAFIAALTSPLRPCAFDDRIVVSARCDTQHCRFNAPTRAPPTVA